MGNTREERPLHWTKKINTDSPHYIRRPTSTGKGTYNGHSADNKRDPGDWIAEGVIGYSTKITNSSRPNSPRTSDGYGSNSEYQSE